LEILYDTREKEKKIAPLLERLQILGASTTRIKLDTGDYVNAEHIHREHYVVVDRKGGGLNEVALNLFQDRQRFTNEILRARREGIMLVVLIEEEHISYIDEVHKWTPPLSCYAKRRLNGITLQKRMLKFSRLYSDCMRFEFVTKEQMANRIYELLS